MKVFKPFTITDTSLPLIVYPFEGVEKISRKEDLTQRIISVFQQSNPKPENSIFGIALPYTQNGKSLNFDLHISWKCDEKDWMETNPVPRDFPWCDGKITRTGDNTCGVGIIVRGTEELYRITMTRNLQEYLAQRPVLPEVVTNNQPFL